MNHQSNQPVKKYDIWFADLPTVPGSHVQRRMRPVIVVSNDTANRYSPLISIVPLTSALKRVDIPTHTVIHSRFLRCPSMALCEQIMTIDKTPSSGIVSGLLSACTSGWQSVIVCRSSLVWSLKGGSVYEKAVFRYSV